MWLGLALTFLTATLWTGVAIGYQRASRTRMPLVPLLLAVTATASLISLGGIRWEAILDGKLQQTGRLALTMAASGVLDQIALLFLARGMRSSHPAAVWVIGQSAILVPFLVAAIYWRDAVQASQWVGLAVVLPALGLMARHGGTSDAGSPPARRAWLLFPGAAFVLLGLSQSLALAPSHWPGWTDAGRLRVTFALVSAAAAFTGLAIVRRQRISPRCLRFALPIAGCVAAGRYSLFAGIDRLNGCGLSAIVFPVAIVGSILTFSLYTRLVLRERFTPRMWAGVCLGAMGIGLLSLRQ